MIFTRLTRVFSNKFRIKKVYNSICAICLLNYMRKTFEKYMK